jgi:hypothetical protein
MKPKGLAHYQAHQSHASDQTLQRRLEVIIHRATLYNVAFLQNKTWLEGVLGLPDCSVSQEETKKMQELLLWLIRAQEGALLSH